MKIWGRGIVYMVEHPIFGVGANNFPVAEGTISPLARRQEYGLGVKWGAAHSTFVQIGAELGFPGLLMVIAVLGSSYLALRRVTKMGNVAGRQRPPPVRLAQALTASLVGFTVGAFFLSLAYSEMLYALVGLTIALQKVGLPKGMARASHAGAARAGRNGWRA